MWLSPALTLIFSFRKKYPKIIYRQNDSVKYKEAKLRSVEKYSPKNYLIRGTWPCPPSTCGQPKQIKFVFFKIGCPYVLF